MKNNIQHIWSVLCQSSIIDQSNNNISLMNIIEEVKVEIKSPKPDQKLLTGSKPILLPMQFEIITLWKRESAGEDTGIESKIEYISPTGKTLHTIDCPITFSENKKRWRSKIKVNGINITTSGEYHFNVKIKRPTTNKFEVVASLPLEISINTEK